VGNNEEKIGRMVCLLDIDLSLECLGLVSQEEKFKWLSSANYKLKGEVPFDVMIRDFLGLRIVRETLRQTFRQDSYEKMRLRYYKNFKIA